jgi:hypothetical protein
LLRRTLFFLLFLSIPRAIGEVSAPQPELIQITRAAVSNWQDHQFYYTNAFDGKLNTSWGTGGSFLERNKEWITLYLERPIFVTKVRIAPGLQQPPSATNIGNALYNFKHNGRPRNLALSFSDGSQQSINLIDFNNESELGFQERNIKPTRTRWVRLQINSIYSGAGDIDTSDVGIAEIEVYGLDSLPNDD